MAVSQLDGRVYDPTKTVRIKNPVQAARYWQHNARPVDIYVDDNDGKFVFVFERARVAKLFDAWVNRTL